MVISLGIRPSICYGEMFQSSDEIHCGNGVLAFGTEEFRNLVLLNLEVEVGGPIASSWCGGNGSLGSSVADAVVKSVKIDIAIIGVVVVMIVFWGQVDIVTSGSGHFAVQSFKFSYLNSCGLSDPCCGVCDPVGIVVVLGAVLESAY